MNWRSLFPPYDLSRLFVSSRLHEQIAGLRAERDALVIRLAERDVRIVELEQERKEQRDYILLLRQSPPQGVVNRPRPTSSNDQVPGVGIRAVRRQATFDAMREQQEQQKRAAEFKRSIEPPQENVG